MPCLWWCVDAHSKWPEVYIMNSTTTTKTLEVLRQFFSAYGLTEQLVTDNGPQFTSEEFLAFVKCNGIKHVRTTPYHPSSNGLAERFVLSLKQSLKTTKHLSSRVSNFLLSYRSCPVYTFPAKVSGHDSICYDQAVTSMWRRNKHFSVMNLVVPFSKTAA